ncbi:hypothetical protein MERGE_002017 [Pneumocystis wakefieldiae]|uniref:Uncharacterized protein n=1 Tax=Pneumocystis wakefieldiae TaxID=38082 RepID=A0A899FWP8_9ASCO|nr:hypothetical protein MERGE_002017 [Pneumocystis wakefieldiae]
MEHQERQKIEKFCHKYARFVARLGKINCHDFSIAFKLSGPSIEFELRQLGFEYGVNFIQKTEWIIENKRPKKWFESLRNKSYYGAKNNLCELMGMGI